MRIEVYTNLVSIKPGLWDIFQQNHVSLATSFYTAKPALHEQLTQGHHSFQRTVANIKYALALGLPLRVGVIDIHSDQEVQEGQRFLRDLGVTQIGIDTVRSVGRGSNLVQVKRPEHALCGACTRGKAVTHELRNEVTRERSEQQREEKHEMSGENQHFKKRRSLKNLQKGRKRW
jgi:MoaA/NifB/PqqE/SkfB family radical SAM enzyme